MHTFSDFVNLIIRYINQILLLLAAVAVALFLFGMLRYIQSEEKGKEIGREMMTWGLGALVLLFCLGGVLLLLKRSFT